MINPHNELTRLSNLIDSIYSCITDPARWEPVIAAAAQWVNAPRAILYAPFTHPPTAVSMVFLTGGDEPVQIDDALWRKTCRLTAAEIRVLLLIAEGFDQAQTTGRLGISANTLKSHLRSICAKTGVSCRSQLMKRVYSFCGQAG